MLTGPFLCRFWSALERDFHSEFTADFKALKLLLTPETGQKWVF